MSTLSVQSDRGALDQDEIDREFSEKKALYENTSLGISLRGQTIYFAEIEKGATAFKVRKFGAIPTNMKFGSGIEGVEKNINDLYSYINGCIEDNAIQAKRFNLSVNTQLTVIHKTFVEANTSEDDFENFVKWEFSKQVLDDVDQFVVNTANLQPLKDTAQLDPVLIVGIRRRFVETLSQVLEKVKIDMTSMDVDILCAHAAYEMNYDRFSGGMTALVELKHGATTILLCNDYEIEHVYQFTTTAKSSPQKVAMLLNAHLDNAIAAYNQNSNTPEAVIGRVILCNELAVPSLPFVESRFNPSVINPFEKITVPEPFATEEKSTDETQEDETKEEPKELPPPPDYSAFAECVGAAIKILTP